MYNQQEIKIKKNYALIFAVELLAKTKADYICFFVITIIFESSLEFLQKLHIIPGTFDFVDIVVEIGATIWGINKPKKGKKYVAVTFTTYYMVPKNAKDIQLEYEADFWTDEKIIVKLN